MSFSESIQSVLSKYATFSGRARRSEYWYFVLLGVLIGIVFGALIRFVGGEKSMLGSLLSGLESLVALALLIPSLAVIWRRLHDIGKSGATFFFILIPLVGQILLLIWLCQDSQPGENQYGPNPKGA